METNNLLNKSSFEHFKLHPLLLAAVKAEGYTDPTPIQKKSIPVILNGKDIIGLAQTGTGKTAAFVLPILQQLMNKPVQYKNPSSPVNPNNKIKVLILVPTRELAEQVQDAVRTFSSGSNIKTVSIYGGVRMEKQLRNLKKNPDIIVACPGRLLDHIKRRSINLSKIEYLVVDEADQLFDMGFITDVRKIISVIPPKRQTLMFSATMRPEIKKFTLEILNQPVTLEADRLGMAQTVSHTLYPVKEDSKSNLLVQLLKDCGEGSVLVFTRTKRRAKRLSEQLNELQYSVTCLQGNLSQSKRKEAMEGFRKFKYKIMVATDIAARGIDITSVSHVINFDIPDTVEAYTHRIGRTGRAAKTGAAFTLITRKDESMVREIEQVLKTRIKRVQSGKWI